MRFTSIVSAALLLFMSSPAIGQEYVEFKSQQDRFGLTFPVQPKVTEITYTSQFGAPLRARVYSAESGQSRFIATVVDYSNLEALLTEKSKSCPPGAETCRGGGSSTGAGYWRADMAGAVIYATAQLMKRNAKVEYFGWNNINLVEGHQLTLINSDKSKPRLRSTCTKTGCISWRERFRRGIRWRISFRSPWNGLMRRATPFVMRLCTTMDCRSRRSAAGAEAEGKVKAGVAGEAATKVRHRSRSD